VACGGNDTFRRDFDDAGVARELTAIISARRATGCQVVTIGPLDITLSGLVPQAYADSWSSRLGRLNALTAQVAARQGALHVDNTDHPVAADPAIYSSDGVHLNARGHAIAAAGTIAPGRHDHRSQHAFREVTTVASTPRGVLRTSADRARAQRPCQRGARLALKAAWNSA